MSDAISISHVSYRFGDHLAVLQRQQRVDQPDRGRLARAVRTEQSEDLTRVDVQGEVLDGEVVTEAVADVTDRDGVTHRAPGSPGCPVRPVPGRAPRRGAR